MSVPHSGHRASKNERDSSARGSRPRNSRLVHAARFQLAPPRRAYRDLHLGLQGHHREEIEELLLAERARPDQVEESELPGVVARRLRRCRVDPHSRLVAVLDVHVIVAGVTALIERRPLNPLPVIGAPATNPSMNVVGRGIACVSALQVRGGFPSSSRTKATGSTAQSEKLAHLREASGARSSP
jgi:hypothetical protein